MTLSDSWDTPPSNPNNRRSSVFCACKISKSLADHASKILISKVDKFYTGYSMIIQKNRRIRISS